MPRACSTRASRCPSPLAARSSLVGFEGEDAAARLVRLGRGGSQRPAAPAGAVCGGGRLERDELRPVCEGHAQQQRVLEQHQLDLSRAQVERRVADVPVGETRVEGLCAVGEEVVGGALPQHQDVDATKHCPRLDHCHALPHQCRLDSSPQPDRPCPGDQNAGSRGPTERWTRTKALGERRHERLEPLRHTGAARRRVKDCVQHRLAV